MTQVPRRIGPTTPRGAAGEPARVNQQLAHERAVLERMVRMESLESVLEALVLGHEALYPGTLGSVLLLDEGTRRLGRGAAPNLPEAYSRAIDGSAIGPDVGSCGTAAFTGRTVVVTDIATDPRWEVARELALSHSLRACWSTPIVSGQGKVLGTFALYYREARAPQEHELAAIESSARIAALAIERSRIEGELRRSAERLALATRSAQMGVFDYDIVQGKLEWDEQMLAIYGVTRAEFGGRYENWRERVHPDDLLGAESQVLESIEGDRPFEATFRIIRPDGELRFVEARTIMQRDASGRATRMIGVNIDVTVKKELQAQLLRSQRLESLGRIAGGIAHDLNNMLAPMLVGPGMLRDLVQDAEGRSLLDTIESSAQRAASVIRQLLTFSRGTDTPQGPVDAGAVVDEMLRIVHGTFPKNIAVSRTGTDAPWTVFGDATQLHQVLMNLCVNARDEMPDGGRLELCLENVAVDAALARLHPPAQAGRFLCIRVVDDGRGIDPQHMERLFEPFFTTKEVGQGTGLGLATVLGIVRSHGGFIEVQSRLGQGSTFSVFLPTTTASADAAPTSPSERPARGRGEQVLVVDDEEAIRRITQGMLERRGYRVLTARNGDEALRMVRAQQGRLALVLTDLMMPGTDGEDLVRALRATDPSVPIVIMSGNIGVGNQYAALKPWIRGILEKPFTLEELLAAVADAVRG